MAPIAPFVQQVVDEMLACAQPLSFEAQSAIRKIAPAPALLAREPQAA